MGEWFPAGDKKKLQEAFVSYCGRKRESRISLVLGPLPIYAMRCKLRFISSRVGGRRGGDKVYKIIYQVHQKQGDDFLYIGHCFVFVIAF